ncbi:hypothetical protein FQN60_002905 [Etheostoma spectabile]|uniref:Uncharacterized protein n=1 Tax=Etheostoma spectabile TaxID=54343 RepID=A0A5J5CHL4_9PERO|nr:hypothetical protein FQN60_002905 [Etheostoma spectabile]
MSFGVKRRWFAMARHTAGLSTYASYVENKCTTGTGLGAEVFQSAGHYELYGFGQWRGGGYRQKPPQSRCSLLTGFLGVLPYLLVYSFSTARGPTAYLKPHRGRRSHVMLLEVLFGCWLLASCLAATSAWPHRSWPPSCLW